MNGRTGRLGGKRKTLIAQTAALGLARLLEFVLLEARWERLGETAQLRFRKRKVRLPRGCLRQVEREALSELER